MTKKRLMQFAFIFFLIIVGWGIYHHYHNKAVTSEDVVVVEAKKVKQGDISIEAKAVGSLTASRFVQITPESSGQIEKILVQDGSFVVKGTPIIQLDDKIYKAKAASAKANLFLSETNYKRMLLLGKQGAISRQAIEQAQADVKEKQALAEESAVTLEKMQLTAPFDGVLGKVMVNPGEHVTEGKELVSLTDIKHLRVEYNVSEKYLSKIKIGQKVKITTSAYPDKEFFGYVTYISATIDKSDRTIELYANVDNEDRLLTSGLFVNVTQYLGEEKNALLVPSESLVPTIDGQEIFKIVNHKAIAVPVIIGQRNINSVEILKGLTPNDLVVTAGQQKLKNGTSVKINANINL